MSMYCLWSGLSLVCAAGWLDSYHLDICASLLVIYYLLLALLSKQPEEYRPLICSFSGGHTAPTDHCSGHKPPSCTAAGNWLLCRQVMRNLVAGTCTVSHYVPGVAMTILYPALFTHVCAQSSQNMKGFMMDVSGLVHIHCTNAETVASIVLRHVAGFHEGCID